MFWRFKISFYDEDMKVIERIGMIHTEHSLWSEAAAHLEDYYGSNLDTIHFLKPLAPHNLIEVDDVEMLDKIEEGAIW